MSFDLFRSFLPRDNPIGFGAADFLEVAWLALLLLWTIAWRPWIEPAVRKIAPRTRLCMLLLGALPVLLRLILLPNHPVPSPQVYDEASHLLVADTLRHFRLANPSHPLHQFFETFFVLQEPTYSSIYPLGQGTMLALGRAIFGLPSAGVVLGTALFCALVFWALRAWVPDEWALLAGLLAVAEFGPLSYWMNSYWGGSLAALAGCLIFGSLPRLRDNPRSREAILLGAGLGIHWLTRPFETVFIGLGALLYFLPWRRTFWRPLAIMTLTLLPVLGLTLLHDKRVTGEWLKLPEMLSQEQYGIPAALTFQPNPIPHRTLTPEQQTEYQIQMSYKEVPVETLGSYAERMLYRVRVYRFFYLTPLYVVLPLFFLALRDRNMIWLLAMLLIYTLGINFFPAYQHHYLGGIACLFLLVSITALRQLARFSAGRAAAQFIVLCCAAHFLFWYSTHLLEGSQAARELRQYETWTAINHRNADQRSSVNEQIAGIPGELLVLVRYYRPHHRFQLEWVSNAADIDGSRVVWARDLGAEENEKLIHYYPNRTVWLLEPEYSPPRLRAYENTR